MQESSTQLSPYTRPSGSVQGKGSVVLLECLVSQIKGFCTDASLESRESEIRILRLRSASRASPPPRILSTIY